MKKQLVSITTIDIFICDGCGGLFLKEGPNGKNYYEDIFSQPARALCFHCANIEQETQEVIHGK